jgi:hypothetical protein
VVPTVPRTLDYAPPRVSITRDDDAGITVTIPPWSRLRLRLTVGICGALGIVCFVFAVHPVPNGSGSAGERVAGAIFGTTCLFGVWALWRTRDVPATISVVGRTLVCRTPHFWGMRERSYDLSEFVDIDVLIENESEGLWLVRARGGSEQLLILDAIFSDWDAADARMAAGALREILRWPLSNVDHVKSNRVR